MIISTYKHWFISRLHVGNKCGLLNYIPHLLLLVVMSPFIVPDEAKDEFLPDQDCLHYRLHDGHARCNEGPVS